MFCKSVDYYNSAAIQNLVACNTYLAMPKACVVCPRTEKPTSCIVYMAPFIRVTARFFDCDIRYKPSALLSFESPSNNLMSITSMEILSKTSQVMSKIGRSVVGTTQNEMSKQCIGVNFTMSLPNVDGSIFLHVHESNSRVSPTACTACLVKRP